MAASVPLIVWPKDPQAVLDYTIDWSSWLKTDRIASVTWTVPGGLSNAGTYRSSTTTTLWLAGGTDGTAYLVQCLIVTVGGRTDERTLQINVGDR